MYNRLFTKILDSSIWLEPANTRIVWVTLLAAMDEDGYAHFSAIENLSARARVSVKETQKAIDCFTSPDPSSANPDNEGRRVERVPGGFLILNADHHRKILNREICREQTRLRVARHREKVNCNKHSVTEALPSVSVTLPASASDSTFASEKKKEAPEFLAQLKAMECYRSINIDREIGKMQAWLLTPKGNGRKLTKGFMVNWLNKVDVPVQTKDVAGWNSKSRYKAIEHRNELPEQKHDDPEFQKKLADWIDRGRPLGENPFEIENSPA